MKKNVLYFILLDENIQAWENNEPDEIELNMVKRVEFDTPFEKQAYIDGMYMVAGSYLLLDEDEYNFLMS